MAELASLETVRDLLMESLNLHEDFEPDELSPDAPLFGDEGLGLDSLDALQLAVSLEEQFGVTVEEGQGRTVFRSVRSIAEYVNAQTG
jgi:acyl carrier protein